MKLCPTSRCLVLAYQGVAPVLEAPLCGAGAGSALLGRVTMGARGVLGPYAVLRADGHEIRVGGDVHFGPRATVHIAHALSGTTIGDRATVGANSVVHACTVGDDALIEDDVVVLDGAVVGPGTVVAAGSVVYPRSRLPAGMWCAGSPAVAVRAVDAAERQALHDSVRVATQAAILAAEAQGDARGVAPGVTPTVGDADAFVAATVTGFGALRMAEGSSLWYGCVVEAAGAGVSIAAGSNVQDNCILLASAAGLTIGADCTIGHNVRLPDCTIGSRVLVGMGSMLAPGTRIADDVMLAAGSTTAPGQSLDGGWLWGGRPARALSRLDERRRAAILGAATIYRGYAREFAASEAA